MIDMMGLEIDQQEVWDARMRSGMRLKSPICRWKRVCCLAGLGHRRIVFQLANAIAVLTKMEKLVQVVDYTTDRSEGKHLFHLSR